VSISLKNVEGQHEPLDVEAVQDGNEVHLRMKGSKHPFVICKRNDRGEAVVGINDVDTGCSKWESIETLNWSR